MTVCYLGIGSNLGNRRQNIRIALQKIRQLKETKIIKISKIIETKPVGGPKNQGDFLNAALKIETSLAPLSLIKKLKNIERLLGRTKGMRFAPRTIDLDILFYGNMIIKNNNLEVPHPEMVHRDFVLGPLSEIL